MDYRECGSHARGVYPTEDTSRKGKARERSRHKNNSKRVVKNMDERKVVTKGKSLKQDLTSAADLTIELPEGLDSPFHRLN